MSGRISGWVIQNGPHPDDVDRNGVRYGNAKARCRRAVLSVIADAANHEGQHAHPGIENIVEGSLYSRRQVIDTLGELADEGWIEVERAGGGRGWATTYRVCVDRTPTRKGAATAPPDLERVQDPTQRVQDPAETVRPRLHPNGVSTVSTTEPPVELELTEPPSTPEGADRVRIVFDAWAEATGRAKAKLDDRRRALIRRALKAYELDDVLAAVRGWRHSPHHRGENDRHRTFNDLELLLRNATKIEHFRDLELEHQGAELGAAMARPATTGLGASIERNRRRESGEACPSCGDTTQRYDETLAATVLCHCAGGDPLRPDLRAVR